MGRQQEDSSFTVRIRPPGRSASDLNVVVEPDGQVIDRTSGERLGRVNRKKPGYLDRAREVAERLYIVTWLHHPEWAGAGWHKGTSGATAAMLLPLARRELDRIRQQPGVSGARLEPIVSAAGEEEGEQ
jgi:hypothetical protein